MIDLKYSPSELISFYVSPYEFLVRKYMKDKDGEYAKEDPEDPFLKIIASKGEDHEKEILSDLQQKGLSITIIDKSDRFTMVNNTLEAMKSGVEIIYQGSVSNDNFYGRTDFLVKEDVPSNLGDYSYQVWDAKLSKSIKPEHILQLCCYADMLSDITGVRPEKGLVITGDRSKEEVLFDDYFSFYKLVKNQFLDTKESKLSTPPNPGDYTNWGLFSEHAQQVLRETDHLYQIAEIRSSEIQKFHDIGIMTVSDLLKDDAKKPQKMELKVFDRIKRQASLQKKSLLSEKIHFEVLENDEYGTGLYTLPSKSKNDIYFDLESNPLNREFVLHYLWGVAHEDREGGFDCWWAHNKEEMKDAFSSFIDWTYDRWLQDKSMHIYHYGHFETSTIRSLMGEFGIKETKVDNLLRNKVFVDLYKVIKHSLCIGTEAYGLKKLEPLFRNTRINEVQSGQDSTVQYEAWIVKQEGRDHDTSSILKEIWDYNKEDCESLIILATWLRNIQHQNNISPQSQVFEDRTKEQEDIEKLMEELLSNLKDGKNKPHSKLLANLSLYHKREIKPEYWRMFDRLESTDEDLINDLDSLGSLEFTEKVIEITTRSNGYEFSYDSNQETKIKVGDQVIIKQDPNLTVTVHEINPDKGTCVLKSTSDKLPYFLSLVPFKIVKPGVIEDSVRDIATRYLQSGDIKPCLENYLSKSRPRIKIEGDEDLSSWGKDPLESALKVATNLDKGYLCIQGPPGTGKTYVGSKLIANLVEKGYRVGVASNSHKAIDNLLQSVDKDLDEQSIEGLICRINKDEDEFYNRSNRVERFKSTSDVSSIEYFKVFGGTAWAFAHPIFLDQLDYLFIDEAGQVSIANLVGMSQCADNLILMGDQMQLSQPTMGTHPEGTGLSSLDYLLGEKPTIPKDIGILLPKTYRLHPDICDFVSKKVYEGRIAAIDDNKKRVIKPCLNSKYLKPSGIQYIELDHYGNEQASPEEVEVIKNIIQELLSSEKIGYEEKKISERDILIISPYNHQTRILQDALTTKYQIGTVDKFQGREAPVVIISMASSDVESSPRGIEFLFEKNRLNVAITRAKSLAIIVGSKNLITFNSMNLNRMNLTNFYIDLVSNS